MVYFTTLLLSMFITLGLIPILYRAAMSLNAVDYPNERKVHAAPTPRVGGFAIAVAVLLPFALQSGFAPIPAAFLVGACLLVVVGVIDDLHGLGHRVKFFAQIAASLIVILWGHLQITSLGDCLPGTYQLWFWLSIPLTVLVMVAATNAVNLIDGLDGLAGGIMLQIFVCLSLLGYCCGDPYSMLLSVACIGAILGFLRFNTHPASIFMGDAGSLFLGFSGIFLSLHLTQDNETISPVLPLLLLGFPVLDTVVVMVERLVNGASPFKADKRHFHHKLMRMGLYHCEAVFILYGIQAVFVSTAYLLRFYSDWIIVWAFLFLVLVLVCPFYCGEAFGARVRHDRFMDRVFKKWLRRTIRERFLAIKIVHKVTEYGVPLILLFTVLLPAEIPFWLGVISGILLCGLAAASICSGIWAERVLRLMLYGLLPLVLYQAALQVMPWAGKLVINSYALVHMLVALAAVMVLNLTRRKKGFKATPTDFLIVCFAVILPFLPMPEIETLHLHFWGTCLIVYFFVVEVLVGELRGNVKPLGFTLVPALSVLAVRGGIV
ncbi:MAG: glycosyl transferase [Deltaproteobacteria bacterium]|nr:MAG: glycosyl transferase [Deltaproteobacteria bacterium]